MIDTLIPHPALAPNASHPIFRSDLETLSIYCNSNNVKEDKRDK